RPNAVERRSQHLLIDRDASRLFRHGCEWRVLGEHAIHEFALVVGADDTRSARLDENFATPSKFLEKRQNDEWIVSLGGVDDAIDRSRDLFQQAIVVQSARDGRDAPLAKALRSCIAAGQPKNLVAFGQEPRRDGAANVARRAGDEYLHGSRVLSLGQIYRYQELAVAVC